MGLARLPVASTSGADSVIAELFGEEDGSISQGIAELPGLQGETREGCWCFPVSFDEKMGRETPTIARKRMTGITQLLPSLLRRFGGKSEAQSDR
jgi:hypothetical protein